MNLSKYDEDRPWKWLGLIFFFSCFVFLGVLEFLPFQDTPQHLAYAKIMATIGQSSNSFSEYYNVVDDFISYHTVHHFMAMFEGLGFNVEIGLKVLLFLYILIAGVGYYYFLKIIHNESKERRLFRFIFFPMIVFNATAGMGFLPFVIGLPLIFYVLAFSTQWQNEQNIFNKYFYFVLLTLVASSLLHVVLPFFFGVILLIYHYRCVDIKKYLSAHGLWALSVFLCAFLWGGFTGDQLLAGKGMGVLESMKFAYGFGFINQVFRVEWTNPFVMLNYVFWNFVGCYRLLLLVLYSLFLALVLHLVINKWNSSEDAGKDKSIKQRKFTFWWIFGLGLFLPWGIYAPSEITFINYRFMTFAVLLGIGFIPTHWLDNAKKKLVISAYCLLSFGTYFTFSYLYQDEARLAQKLIEKLPAKTRLMSLMFDDKSAYFAKILDLTHFMPMYYTIRHNGLNSQFWARYTKHLPVEYRRGKKINGPADWKPWNFKKTDLKDIDYVIMQVGGDPKRTKYSKKLQAAFSKSFQVVARENNWFLFKIARP